MRWGIYRRITGAWHWPRSQEEKGRRQSRGEGCETPEPPTASIARPHVWSEIARIFGTLDLWFDAEGASRSSGTGDRHLLLMPGEAMPLAW
jgi:hypothetical protein